MGSATTQAEAATKAALDAASGIDLDVSRELFAAARAVGDSPQLGGALADSSASADARAKVVADVFGAFRPVSLGLLTTAVAQRWSSASDLVDGIEELAVRAAARSDAEADVEGELFRFSRTVAANPELELALGSKLAVGAGKSAVVDALLAKKAHPGTLAIVDHLVRTPRGRRIGEMLSDAADIVAGAGGRRVVTVTSAVALSSKQQDRLAAALKAQYGSDIQINSVLDPAVVGGVRVQIGDDVIDGTVAARLADLRLQLAG